MFGFFVISVSMSETCLAATKFASVTAITLMPRAANSCLSPAVCAVDQSLPPFRSLAIQLEPGIRQLPETIRTGTPWLIQFKRLLRKDELGIDARYLAQSGPGLAQAASAGAGLFNQTNLLSLCTSHNLVPSGNVALQDSGSSLGQQPYRAFQ